MKSTTVVLLLLVFGIIVAMIHETYADGWEVMEHEPIDKKTMKVCWMNLYMVTEYRDHNDTGVPRVLPVHSSCELDHCF